MSLTTAQLKQAFIDNGADAVDLHREGSGTSVSELLGTYTQSGAAYGSLITWSSTDGPENAATGNYAKAPGGSSATSVMINLGDMAGAVARGNANGGWAIGFSMATTATAWQVGYTNSTNTLLFASDASSYFKFSYKIGGTTIVSGNDTIVGYRSLQPLGDGYFHRYLYVWDHTTGTLTIYVDGELWLTCPSVAQSSFRSASMVGGDSFYLGAYNLNGSTAWSPFAAGYHASTFYSSPIGADAAHKDFELATQASLSANSLPAIIGPRANELSGRLSLALKTAAPVIAVEGDSTLSAAGNGVSTFGAAAREIARQFNLASGGRLANMQILFGNGTDDAYSPPGMVGAATASSTTTIGFSVKFGDPLNVSAGNFYGQGAIGSTPALRLTESLDRSKGLRFDCYMRKQPSVAAGVTWTLIGGYSDMYGLGSATLTADQVVLGTASFTAGELTGATGTKAMKSITAPNAGRYPFYAVRITWGATAVVPDFLDVISVKNAAGPRVYVVGKGGSKIADLTANYANRFALYTLLGVTHLIDVHGLNDSLSQSASAFATDFAAYELQARTAMPSLVTIYGTSTAKELGVDGSTGKTTMISNERSESYAGALAEWLAANPTLPVFVANARAALYRQFGWSPGTQTLLGKTPVAHDGTTTKAAGDVVYVTLPGTVAREYFIAIASVPTGKSTTDQNYYFPVAQFLTDGTHHTYAGVAARATALVHAVLSAPETTSSGDVIAAFKADSSLGTISSNANAAATRAALALPAVAPGAVGGVGLLDANLAIASNLTRIGGTAIAFAAGDLTTAKLSTMPTTGTIAKAGDAMALTAAERDATATRVEYHLLDDGDGTLFVNAIVGAIGNTNLDQAAVVAAIRADLERTGGKLQLIDAKTTTLPAFPTNFGALSISAGGQVASNLTQIGGSSIAFTAGDLTTAKLSTLPTSGSLAVQVPPLRPAVIDFADGGQTPTTIRVAYQADAASLGGSYVGRQGVAYRILSAASGGGGGNTLYTTLTLASPMPTAINNVDLDAGVPLPIGSQTAVNQVITVVQNTAPTAAQNATAVAAAIAAAHGAGSYQASDAAALLSGRKLTINSIVQSDGSLEFYAGGAYATTTPGWPTLGNYAGPSLAGAAIELRIIESATYRRSGSSSVAVLKKSGTASQSGVTVTLAFALSAVETATVASVFPVDNAPTHQAQIWATGSATPLVDLPCTFRRSIT